MPKIAFLTPIFSDKALGGAERLVLDFSRLLSKDFEITIITTTAVDYRTWRNVYKEGISNENGVKIYRFKVKKKRSFFFSRVNHHAIQKQNLLSDNEFENWLQAQGPYVPDLIEFVKENYRTFDLFFCFTYLYYPVVKSIPYVYEKAICVLTLHNEKVAYFPQFKKIYTPDLYYCFNVPEEKDLYEKVFNSSPKNFKVIGMSIPIPSQDIKPYLHSVPYILYIGRMDKGKGIETLIQSFLEWKALTNSNWKLICIGGGRLSVQEPSILHLGFVSELKKQELICGAELIVNPSALESFSIVIMEAWTLQKAVLVNGDSEVLRNHCIRSNAGLFYTDKQSFIACLEFLYKHPELREKMGKNGRRYVEMNYNSNLVKKKLLSLIQQKLTSSSHRS